VSVKNKLESLEEVVQIAQLAGMKAHLEEEEFRVIIGIGLSGDRSQLVYIRITGEAEDSPIITIFSPCRIAKKKFWGGGITREQAIDLLKRNEQVMFARFGIHSGDGQDLVVASSDHLLKQLDPEELRSAVLFTAKAADDYEKEFGVDRF